MLKRLKLSVVIASVMLVLLGFSSFEARAQNEVCPFVPVTDGWLRLGVGSTSDFTSGLLGTFEVFGGSVVGGIDWLYGNNGVCEESGVGCNFDEDCPLFETEGEECIPNLSTTQIGGQLLSWWTQREGRNTFLQVTNTAFFGVTLHVRILDATCTEIRDFCDDFTGNDTHVYNFGDLVSNAGQPISDGVLQGKEGIVVVTPVDSCPADEEGFGEAAIVHNFLQGSERIIDSDNNFDYGTNVYARRANDEGILINPIDDPSFELFAIGGDTEWFAGQDFPFGVDPNAFFSGDTTVPRDVGTFVGYLTTGPGDKGGGSYNGGDAGINLCADPSNDCTDLLDNGNTDDDVSVLEQFFFVFDTPGDTTVPLTFDVMFLTSEIGGTTTDADFFIGALINLTPQFFGGFSFVQDADCITSADVDFFIPFPGFPFIGSPFRGTFCDAANTDGLNYAGTDGTFYFGTGVPGTAQGGRQTGYQTLTLDVPPGFNFFALQFIVGDNAGNLVDTAALVDNIVVTVFAPCDTLDGSPTCSFQIVDPTVLAKDFSIVGVPPVAAADLVLMSVNDDYGLFPGDSPYSVVAGNASYAPDIFDEFEVQESCGDFGGCFVRIGIDDPFPISEDFPSPPPIVSPPPTGSPRPSVTPPPACTKNSDCPAGFRCKSGVCVKKGKGKGGCAIGGPVGIETAMANILIPLVPAFAIGFRVLRRRGKKNEKK